MQQKIILITVFGMNVFVIATAVLTKEYPSGTVELVLLGSLGLVYVTNLPGMWALIRDIFSAVRYWGYPKRTYSDGTVHNRKAWSSLYGTHVSTNDEGGDKDDPEFVRLVGAREFKSRTGNQLSITKSKAQRLSVNFRIAY
jgi:hypothetical protein